MSSLFKNTHFLLIEDGPGEAPESRDEEDITNAEIEGLIVEHGGSFDTRSGTDSLGAIEALQINHIITRTTSFLEYRTAAELMIPMTNPRWLVDSCGEFSRKNYRLYSPKPSPFMDKVMLCIADNLAQGDKEIMYSGVRAFGGQYLDALSRYTTHLVALDLTNNKSVIAANIKRTDDFDIKIVLPHWVDECVRQQRRVDEKPFLLMNPKVLQTGKPDKSLEDTGNSSDSHKKSQVLSGKRVYLASDYNLSEHLKQAIISLVENSGGSVQSEFDPEKIDVYVGKYRSGSQFKACFLDERIEVANLQWLYFVVTNDSFVQPLASNMLHFPAPEDEISSFKNMRISITGITSDARHYLSSLIVAMGATFTKTLDCNNDFLVCAQKSGEKYAAVRARWPDIKIVNHLWIEECYAKWQFLDPKSARFSTISPQTQLLGKARISRADVGKMWQADDDKVSNVSDSINEEEDSEGLENEIEPSPLMYTPVPKETGTADTTAEKTQAAEVAVSSPRDRIVVGESSVLSSPAAGEYVRAGRSAKAKASLKLHSNMEDLNQYTSMSKSSRKMKTYMDELEKTASPAKTTPRKAPAASKNNVEEISDDEVEKPPPKKAKTDKEIHMVAILTGCESVLTLSKADTGKLAKLGIQIVNDYSPRKSIDTIFAPKVLRTEKFLKSLSKAERILHPSFLSHVLKRHAVGHLTWAELTKEFNVKNYSLDNIVSVKQINEDLGVVGKTSGFERLLAHDVEPVFTGMALNLSSNLNGGPDLIGSILQEHGLFASKTVKLTAGTRKSGLLSMEDGTAVLVAHKGKDKKMASNLDGVTVVEWEWCVKSIFHKSVQSFDEYIIKA